MAAIAQRYKVRASDVSDWNDVKTSSRFKGGERVTMYLPVRLSTTSFAAQSPHQPKVAAAAKGSASRSARAAPAKAAAAKAAPAKSKPAAQSKGGTPAKRKH